MRDCSMVSVYPLLLFGGGSIHVDLSDGQFVLSVDDGWIRFIAASHEVCHKENLAFQPIIKLRKTLASYFQLSLVF